jgi:hypothetical protein
MDTLSNQQKRGDLITASLLFVLMTGRYGWDSQVLMGDFFNSYRNTWYDNRNARLKSAAVNTAIILLTCVLISDKTNGKNILTGDSWMQLSNKGIDHDDTFLEGLEQIIKNLRNIKTSYGIQGPNYSDALLLAQELENVLLVGVNVFARAIEILNVQMVYYNDKDLWVEDEDLEMLKKGLKGEIGNINWLEDNVFDSILLNDEKIAKIRSEIIRDGIEHDGGKKKYSSKKKLKNKSKKSLQNIFRKNRLQIAGGKDELLKQLRTLEDQLYKLREIDRTNPHDTNDMRIYNVISEIEKIKKQLEQYFTPEEKQAKEREDARIRAMMAEHNKKVEEFQKKSLEKFQKSVLLEKQKDELKLKKVKQAQLQRLEEYESSNSYLLKDKKWVETQLEDEMLRWNNLTHDGQPMGASLSYAIWHELLVDLYKKYL